MPAEHAALGAAGLGARQLGSRANQQGSGDFRWGIAVDDIGHDAGDVVGAARLETGADHLGHRVVGGPTREDVGEAGVVEHPGGAVAAQEEPVACGHSDREQVGLGLVHAVDRPEDEVAMRVDPRILLGDPALVDEALDERVVLGELAELTGAVEVAPAVAHVPDADLLAVEHGHRHRGAGAVDRRVLVDELSDPVVGAVDGAGDRTEEVVARFLVEPDQLRDRRTGGDVTARGSAHAIADGEQPGAGISRVLVVLADATHVGERGEVEAQRHLTSSIRGWSCRCGSWCRVRWSSAG